MVVGLEEFRAGTVRESMLRNRLIAKDELGKPKKVLFNNPPGARSDGAGAPRSPSADVAYLACKPKAAPLREVAHHGP